MSRTFKSVFCIILSILFLFQTNPVSEVLASSSSDFALVILSSYEETLDIQEEVYVIAITSTGKKATWSSSNSKVASVNTYGKITGKKAGTATITAKIKNAEASVKVTVTKTIITLNQKSASIEHNGTVKLTAKTSNGSTVTFKSSKKSVATVSDTGLITGVKPGSATITATADGTSVTCSITVKSPTVKLNKSSLTLEKGDTAKLTATVSSKITPTWKSSKKSVAVVDENGKITALKHGTAVITATVDGVSKICEVVVEKPTITLNAEELNLTIGDTYKLTATVTNGYTATWTTSKSSVAFISDDGTVTALAKGTAYIYATEDGTKVKCIVHVTASTDD